MTGLTVLELNRAIHPSSSRLRITAVLKAYFDDSRDGKSEKVFSLGGYVAKEEAWEQFEREWSRRSGGAVFHMADLLAGFGDFRGWEQEKRFDLIWAMMEILNGIEVWGFHCAIVVPEFREIFPDDDPEAPYFLCFQQCFSQAAKWGNDLQDNVACFFDREEKYKYRACRLFDHVKTLEDRPGWEAMKRLVSITFGPRAEYTPLQAADLAAYTGCNVLTKLLAGKDVRSIWWLDEMKKNKRLFGELWNKDRLLDLRTEVVSAKAAGTIPYVIKRKSEAK
jgi:hypothetical protein